MTQFPRALPHGPIEEVFPDVFFVTGGYRAGAGVTITRNMTIVRRGGALVLVNSVRLTDEGERELAKLGEVKHVIRLGSFHGVDDPYYASRFEVPIWGPPKMKHSRSITDARELRPDSHPLDGDTIFSFDKGNVAEAALVLKAHGGVLVTCDSYQNWTSFDGCSFAGKWVLRAMGFGPLHIGGPWTKAMGPAVRDDFNRLLAIEFRHLLPAHGTPLRDTAVDGLHTAIKKRFG